jgi:hypothetical protein
MLKGVCGHSLWAVLCLLAVSSPKVCVLVAYQQSVVAETQRLVFFFCVQNPCGLSRQLQGHPQPSDVQRVRGAACPGLAGPLCPCTREHLLVSIHLWMRESRSTSTWTLGVLVSLYLCLWRRDN